MKRPRRPNDTEEAIDKAVDSAADAVERRLDHEGIPKPRVTARDVLRSRYPRDTVDEEDITEQMAEGEPFSRFGPDEPITTPMAIPTPFPAVPIPTPPPMRPRPTPGAHTPSGHSSLSPIALGPRPSRPPTPTPIEPMPISSRPSSHGRRAAKTSTPKRRGRPRTFFSRAPSAPWVLALITLGGATAFFTVMAVRSPGFIATDSSSRRAAAGPELALPEAGVTAPLADAAVMIPSAAPTPRSPKR